KLTVKNDAFGRFKPFVELEDFPEGLSEREAMLKLADWLHRLSVAIEDNWSTPGPLLPKNGYSKLALNLKTLATIFRLA
ncbi:hypothetical protein ACMYLP_23155, partial [Salmonella enterica subsp. enterica serovar Enteritidis]